MNIYKTKLIKWFFIVFILFYASLFLINAQLGPNDDFVFLRTLQSGKPLIYASDNFPYYDWKGLGRFQPLVSMEYNLIGLFSRSPSPFWYYFIHAIEFMLFMFLFVNLLKNITKNKKLIYGTSILLSLLPSFTFSWFRLQLPERNLIFLFVIFLLCLLSYQKTAKLKYLIIAFISSNLAIYYKEIVFIIIGAFAISHLILSYKNNDKRLKIFDIALIFSSFAYFIIYYFLIYRQTSLFLFRTENLIYSSLIVYVKNIFNYAFFSDSILILILLPLFFTRFYKIFFKKEQPNPIYDSALLAGSLYIFAFFILNLYNPYYLLPAYGFAIPSIIYFFTQKEFEKNRLFWKIIIFASCFLLLVNSLPSGIHFLTWHKYVPINFNKTLNFLINDINSKKQGGRINIFLDGINLAEGRGAYFIFGEFMLANKKIESQKNEDKVFSIENNKSSPQFDLKSNVATKNPEPVFSKIKLPFSVFEKDIPDEIKKGDYLIIIPQSPKNTTKTYVESLKNDYELAFQTKSRFEFPQINLKVLAKYIILKKQKKNSNSISNNIIVSENLLDSPDYYVFIKK